MGVLKIGKQGIYLERRGQILAQMLARKIEELRTAGFISIVKCDCVRNAILRATL